MKPFALKDTMDYFEDVIERREAATTHPGAGALCVKGEYLLLPVDRVAQNPYQPRKFFAAEDLRELADSIAEYGVLLPITVRLINGRNYELVAGERRLRAAKIAGLATIPAVIVEIGDRDSAVLALVENIQRKDLNYLEEAEGLMNLARDYSMTQEEIARRIGKSQSSVANKMRILRLPEVVKRLLIAHKLTERHARELLRLEILGCGAAKAQAEMTNRVIEGGLNVSQTEAAIKRYIERRAEAVSPRPKIKTYIRDIRIFTNTIKHACEVMCGSGLNAAYNVEERGDGYFIGITIQK